MSHDALKEVRGVVEGGVWTDTKLLGDDSWEGEKATSSEHSEVVQAAIVPKTPAQEDREIISSVIKNPEFIGALVREIEKRMLMASGRPTGTSVLQQITNEREDAIDNVRKWIETTQSTRAVELSSESQTAMSKIVKLEEMIATLEMRIEELMASTVSQIAQEKEIIEEACKILQDRRREDDLTSHHTPSEVTRMEMRTAELDQQITRMSKKLVVPTREEKSEQPAAKNRRKFGALF